MSLKDDEFYMEGGKFVLTERYHLRRGHCCGNGCRHCPHDYSNVPPSQRTEFVAEAAAIKRSLDW